MPGSQTIHNDKALSNISVAFKSDRMIADELYPAVQVKHESDKYYVYSKQSLIVPETRRANGAKSKESSFELSTSSYQLEEESLKDIVTDRDRANADAAIRLNADTTENLTEKIMMRREKDAAELSQTKANWGQNTSFTAAQQWTSNTTTTNPITTIDSACSAIAKNSGKLPNMLAVNDPQFRILKEHISVVDRVKYTSSESVGPGLLARLFNVSKLMVGGAIENTAQEGLTDSMAFIWTDTAFLAYMEQSPGLKKISAGYVLQQGAGRQVRRWREEERKGDFIEVSSLYTFKAVATDAAFLLIATNG